MIWVILGFISFPFLGNMILGRTGFVLGIALAFILAFGVSFENKTQEEKQAWIDKMQEKRKKDLKFAARKKAEREEKKRLKKQKKHSK